jgi:DNA invertase Pin-like site-specific DNA recombinase
MPRIHTFRTATYARVSTLDQDPAMQLRELRAYARHRGRPSIDAQTIEAIRQLRRQGQSLH